MSDGGPFDTEAHAVIVRARRMMWGAVLVAAALIILAASVFYSVANRPHPFAPLGPFPRQHVVAEHNDQELPVVSLSHPVVSTRGTKCSDPFDGQINGTVTWQSLNPRGVSIVTGQGTRDTPSSEGERCVSFTYRNDIPEGVASIMARQLSDGLHPIWRITGTETPTSDTRGVGVPLTWVTEPFRVAP